MDKFKSWLLFAAGVGTFILATSYFQENEHWGYDNHVKTGSYPSLDYEPTGEPVLKPGPDRQSVLIWYLISFIFFWVSSKCGPKTDWDRYQ